MYIVVFVTTSNKKEASLIASVLIKKRLAACVNIVDKIKSIFWWRALVDKTDEVLLVIKSRKSKLNKIIKCVKSLHSYQVPEIIALPIIGGNKDYLDWLDESVDTSH